LNIHRTKKLLGAGLLLAVIIACMPACTVSTVG
jgi:hypothetical protein